MRPAPTRDEIFFRPGGRGLDVAGAFGNSIFGASIFVWLVGIVSGLTWLLVLRSLRNCAPPRRGASQVLRGALLYATRGRIDVSQKGWVDFDSGLLENCSWVVTDRWINEWIHACEESVSTGLQPTDLDESLGDIGL